MKTAGLIADFKAAAEKLSDLCALGLRNFSEGGSAVKKILSPLQG